jgi:cystathionine beta-synthase
LVRLLCGSLFANSKLTIRVAGYEFVPEVLDRTLVDTWIKINDDKAFAMARKLIRTEGLLIGGSSGCAMAGAIEYLTQDDEGKKIGQTPGLNIVVIMPDS